MNYFRFQLFVFAIILSTNMFGQVAQTISLNGKWEVGLDRKYEKTIQVPGIAQDPTQMNKGTLWYKRQIVLPSGTWKKATLKLNGARFNPSVYINGTLISEQNGGMAPTFFSLQHPDVKPGNTITIEIALKSLMDIKETDASCIPKADYWRSNISSYLWDDVILDTYGDARIDRIIPFSSIKNDRVTVACEVKEFDNNPSDIKTLEGEIINAKGKVVAKGVAKSGATKTNLEIPFNGKVRQWSPEQPVLYQLRLSLKDKNGIVDMKTISYGLKEFSVKNKRFYLNGNPYQVRANTVVWHRWTREKEAESLAWDTTWFVKNMIKPLKDRGANTIRFHLGTPPERILNLCDQYGLLVQYEWSFFHGMPASEESLLEQWRTWLDRSMLHPSVSLIHPYNETEGEQLKTAWRALDKLALEYPPLVLEERDVIHVHKYWWSLFENLGLYYDSASQFPKAIQVDEFGGNYLNGNIVTGRVQTIKESFWRFLGPEPTPEQLLYLHTNSNAKVAEYWRRIGAAGFSPFCSVGSSPDGDHWYLGDIADGKLKPVWNAMAAAWSPVSASIDVWDRDFIAGQKVNLPVYFINDTGNEMTVSAEVGIKNTTELKLVSVPVPAYSKVVKNVSVIIPAKEGRYTFESTLRNKLKEIKVPVVSAWDFRVLKAEIPEGLVSAKVLVLKEESELKRFLTDQKIYFTEYDETSNIRPTDSIFNLILTSQKSWDKIENNNPFAGFLQAAIKAGKSAVILDAGPRFLGQGYPTNKGELGPLQGVVKLEYAEKKAIDFYPGITLKFREVAEPESFIHPTAYNNQLWNTLLPDYGWIWNGMRGGLIVPATGMEIEAQSASAFINLWKVRGADESMIKVSESYFGYELEGFYAFSSTENDPKVISQLNSKVKLIFEDAPSIAKTINKDAKVKIVNLSGTYSALSKQSTGIELTPLACCGKGLSRIPCVLIDFNKEKSKVVISQLLTSGRLAPGYGQEGFYGIRYDEAAVQMVLNMLNLVVK